ncbi:putative uncharacterized protein DDB_G0286901 [Drosophila sulfurigaster albostrigata]|uniref:putative uncharacterized protein DDB_G0286901 n=1 Tax=Drosophila sulfurigaster albostrigata TaxID=89887 RepID=UPI002D21ABDC|nr:putative uncharacterized protein DDB_G0286901 [Drosophila sulfurigaster albostrigata]
MRISARADNILLRNSWESLANMNSRNQKKTNNQTQKRMNFRNNNSNVAKPAHNSSRQMIDNFETGQRMGRPQITPDFPQIQRRNRIREQLRITPDRFQRMDNQRCPAPETSQDNIPDTYFQPDRRPYASSTADGQGFLDNQHQMAPEYNRNPEKESSVFGRRSNNSPQQLSQFNTARQHSRSPAHGLDLGRISPERSSWRGSEEENSRRSRESPGASNRPDVRAEESVPQMGEAEHKINTNKRQLCGSRVKWYYRYIKQGFSRDEAFFMAKEPTQPSAKYRSELSRQDGKPSPLMRRPNTADKSQSRELKMPSHTLNRQSPEPKRRKPSWDDDRPGPSKRLEENEERLKICLMPLGYPREKLTHQEKLDLEEAITMEVASSKLGVPLRFTSVAFKTGYLEVECFNKFSADWLMRTGPQLPEYHGHPVETKMKRQQKEHIITVYLPRSAGKSEDFLLQLIKSQNTHNIDLWSVVGRTDSRDGDAEVVFSIDDQSAAEIASNGHTIFYRMSKIPVRGLEQVDSGQEKSSSEVLSHANQYSPSFGRNRDGGFIEDY